MAYKLSTISKAKKDAALDYGKLNYSNLSLRDTAKKSSEENIATALRLSHFSKKSDQKSSIESSSNTGDQIPSLSDSEGADQPNFRASKKLGKNLQYVSQVRRPDKGGVRGMNAFLGEPEPSSVASEPGKLWKNAQNGKKPSGFSRSFEFSQLGDSRLIDDDYFLGLINDNYENYKNCSNSDSSDSCENEPTCSKVSKKTKKMSKNLENSLKSKFDLPKHESYGFEHIKNKTYRPSDDFEPKKTSAVSSRSAAVISEPIKCARRMKSMPTVGPTHKSMDEISKSREFLKIGDWRQNRASLLRSRLGELAHEKMAREYTLVKILPKKIEKVAGDEESDQNFRSKSVSPSLMRKNQDEPDFSGKNFAQENGTKRAVSESFLDLSWSEEDLTHFRQIIKKAISDKLEVSDKNQWDDWKIQPRLSIGQKSERKSKIKDLDEMQSFPDEWEPNGQVPRDREYEVEEKSIEPKSGSAPRKMSGLRLAAIARSAKSKILKNKSVDMENKNFPENKKSGKITDQKSFVQTRKKFPESKEPKLREKSPRKMTKKTTTKVKPFKLQAQAEEAKSKQKSIGKPGLESGADLALFQKIRDTTPTTRHSLDKQAVYIKSPSLTDKLKIEKSPKPIDGQKNDAHFHDFLSSTLTDETEIWKIEKSKKRSDFGKLTSSNASHVMHVVRSKSHEKHATELDENKTVEKIQKVEAQPEVEPEAEAKVGLKPDFTGQGQFFSKHRDRASPLANETPRSEFAEKAEKVWGKNFRGSTSKGERESVGTEPKLSTRLSQAFGFKQTIGNQETETEITGKQESLDDKEKRKNLHNLDADDLDSILEDDQLSLITLQSPEDKSLKLLNFCKKNQWKQVELFLKNVDPKIINLSVNDEEGLTPLLLAVKAGKIPIVEHLLELGEMLDEKTKDGRGVAHIAAQYAKDDMLRFLLSRHIKIDEPYGPFHETPLHIAASRPAVQAGPMVSLLLKNCPPESRLLEDVNGTTPLMAACQAGNLAVCRELLSQLGEKQTKIRRKDTGDGVLHAAVRVKNPDLVRLLAEHGALVNVQNNEGKTPLYLVAEGNFENMLKVFYQLKADPNISDKHGTSPLYVASEKGYTGMVELLADRFKASVFTRTKDGSTLMHIASKFGYSDLALLFLKRGVPLCMPNKSGALGLHLAAAEGNVEVIKALLSKGSPVDSKTKDNYTPLHVAVQAAKPEVIEILLGYGADVSVQGGQLGETALHVAAGLKNAAEGLRCAEMLIKSGADTNSKLGNGETALHIASKNGNVPMVQLLIAEGADPLVLSMTGDTPLHMAARFCHFETAKSLLEYVENNRRRDDCTAAVNKQAKLGETPMHLAAESGKIEGRYSGEDVDLMNMLLDYGGEINSQINTTGETVLHYSARAGNEEVLRAIVKKIGPGAVQIALNKQSKVGWSPLMEACAGGHSTVVKILLENHARVDVFDESGKTALHLAAEHGHVEICDSLIKNKAFINSKTKAGFTPLHFAAINGHYKVVLLLVQTHKAFVDVVNGESCTPLHLAAQSGQLQVCTILLNLGANPSVHESRGRTALHLAAESDHPEVVKLFLNVKSDLSTLMATDENGLTCAHIAAMKGSVAVIKELMLIDRKVVIDAKTKDEEATTLHMATAGGHKNVVKILLAAGADPAEENSAGMTALQIGAKFGHSQILDVFNEELWRRCSRKTGLSPLHVASFYGHMEFVRALLVHVNPTVRSEPPLAYNPLMGKDLVNEYFFTPLHMAAQSGREGLVRLLLNFQNVQVDAATALMILSFIGEPSRGLRRGFLSANLTLCAIQTVIPLHLAAQFGHVAVVGMLLSRSTQQLQMKDSRGRTALHVASAHGHFEMVSLLLAQGSNINVLDQNGWTALHYATSAGYAQVVKLLVENGADPMAETRDGKVALCFAAAKSHMDVLIYLMQQQHDTPGLMDDRKFVYDLMLCGKNKNNRSVEEFVLSSPAPIETAVKMSSLYKYLAANEKERSKDLFNVSEFCEQLAVELLTITSTNHNPALLLKAVDMRGRPFIDILIENEQKVVVSHASVQRYLSEVWGGGIKWGLGKFAVFFVIVFLCPPAWIFFSLPGKFRVSEAPIIKFVCHLVSHIYFTILLIIEVLCVVQPIYEINSIWPEANEWLLLLWLSGILVAELSRLGGRTGLAYVKLFELFLSCLAVILHFLAFLVPSNFTDSSYTDRDRLKLQQTLLYMRNQMFSITALFSFTQYLEFLTVHHLFGPWAIIIRDLMYDLTRFLVILCIFMFGFTVSISAIFQPAFAPIRDEFSKDLMRLTTLPETVQMLYFALFGLVDPTNMPPLHLVPDLGTILLKVVFGVYLLVVIIVLINLLIAMMSDTYQRIQAQSDVEWKFGRAKLIREMNKKSATPPPINIFTKFFTLVRVAYQNKGKMCTIKAQDDLKELENIDAYSMSDQTGRISPSMRMVSSKEDEFLDAKQKVRKMWKIENVINWKHIVEQYRISFGQKIADLSENVAQERLKTLFSLSKNLIEKET